VWLDSLSDEDDPRGIFDEQCGQTSYFNKKRKKRGNFSHTGVVSLDNPL